MRWAALPRQHERNDLAVGSETRKPTNRLAARIPHRTAPRVSIGCIGSNPSNPARRHRRPRPEASWAAQRDALDRGRSDDGARPRPHVDPIDRAPGRKYSKAHATPAETAPRRTNYFLSTPIKLSRSYLRRKRYCSKNPKSSLQTIRRHRREELVFGRVLSPCVAFKVSLIDPGAYGGTFFSGYRTP
jgi:hypothetical protein